MSIIRQDLVILSCNPILKCLTINNGTITKVSDKPVTLKAPMIRDFEFIRTNARMIWIFQIKKDVISNSLDYLNNNGHINFKAKDLQNKYERTFQITDKGLEAIDYSYYTKTFIKRWARIIRDLSIIAILVFVYQIIKRTS